MVRKTVRTPLKMFFSPGYDKTIRHSVCQGWETLSPAAKPLWPRCVFQSERAGGWYLQRYNFPYLVIELMLEGELRYDVGGVRHLSSEGEIHITPPGSDVRVESTELGFCKRIGLELHGPMVDPLCESLRLGSPVNFPANSFGTISDNLQSIMHLLEKKEPGTEPDIAARCYDTLTRLGAELDQGGRVPLPVVLKKLLDYIHSNLHQPLSCTELAQTASCSPSTLMRLFQRYLQETPQAYVNRCRLQHARQMLLSQELSVKQVAAMMGFKNQFYFSRAFKKEFGVPPTQARHEA